MKISDYTARFRELETPFYFYDLDVLRKNLEIVKKEASDAGYVVHYAIKANANPVLLKIISSYGFGADCVSWNEIAAALEAGFEPSGIVFAGVGKSDREIENAVKAGIFCFNCESIPEMEVIDDIASRYGRVADIALRINPQVEAHTHKYITTGIEESKFGINMWELEDVTLKLASFNNLNLIGIHFHVGSQITKMSVFQSLCSRINELQEWFAERNFNLKVINVGGGLGINYDNPEEIPSFREYFSLLSQFVIIKPGQTLHMEPGRAIVGQCGSLITKVLYIKNGKNTKFAIVDAGMTDLIRPALYQAKHKIENISAEGSIVKYDVVGPICESSDVFGKQVELIETKRGDIIAIRSAGAYGEVMASRYNLRNLPAGVYSDDLR